MIEVPAIRREGYEAMARGMGVRLPEYPLGLCFVPEKYRPDSVERENFLVGCRVAVFGGTTQ